VTRRNNSKEIILAKLIHNFVSLSKLLNNFNIFLESFANFRLIPNLFN